MTKGIMPTYVVRLRLVDEVGSPAAGYRVQAFDQDRGRSPDRLGEGVTGMDGSVAFRFDQSAAGGRAEGDPEFFVVVHSPEGVLVHQSAPVAIGAGERDLGSVRVRSVQTPAPAGVDGTVVVGPSNAPGPRDPSPAGDNRVHGSSRRGVLVPRSPFYHGPFGRMFRQLPAWVPPGVDDAAREGAIRSIAGLMLEPEGPADAIEGENPGLPVGYTYFGQFVDHDITFDPTSSLARLNDPDRLVNFRTPRFDLDNLYGEGPDDEPFMYDQVPGSRGRFLIGKVQFSSEADLPRNEQGTALIGDPRNDENLIVSQMQLAFLLLHNRVIARVEAEEGLTGREAFTRAQTLVRWHYQWVVLFDFLPRICGAAVVDQVLRRKPGGTGFAVDLRFYKFRDAPFMPVEFSGAAYRFGHSQIRQRYDLNAVVTGVPIFLPPESNPGPTSDLRGFRRLPGMWSLDWRRFLDLGGGVPQKSRRIDARLNRALSSIPAGSDPAHGASLAALNLLRGWRLGLPSGQAVARAVGAVPLSTADLGLSEDVAGSEAPLWYYVLKEAELSAAGAHLGPVGGRIVAETLVGLAKADPGCFINVDPSWSPARAFGGGAPLDVQGDALQLSGLIRAAGRDGAPF